jgi:uncharacterized membrane protein YagU involved in acid resistance
MNDLVSGALAGLAATVPMTGVMEVLHRRLPPQERYPLPPREISDKVMEEAGIDNHLDEQERKNLALLSHFAYGATVGALYGPLSRVSPLPPVLSGVAYGLCVWAGSYLGLLPALGILRPATEHPPRRTALMIAAHVVWGSVLGALVDGRPSGSEARRRGPGKEVAVPPS